MAAKKAVDLSKLPFSELKDKAKEIEGAQSMNRFEMTQAVLRAESKTVVDAEKNPRKIKPEIKSIKAKMAESSDKKARKELRRTLARLKKQTRVYL